ncbi:MAG: MFS transporter [Chloroflexi bacterium]|nr:MFS transporter [Chloroflexota bacterium]
MPRSLAMAVMMPISGRFYNTAGPRLLTGTGLLVSAYSFLALSRLSLDTGYWDIFWPQVWQGFGFSLIFISLTTAALSNIPRPKMTSASGLYNVTRQVFGSIGIAISASQLTEGTATYRAVLSEHVTAFDAPTRTWLGMVTQGMAGSGADPLAARQQALSLLDLNILGQASVMAYNRVFVLVAGLFLLVSPLALLLGTGQGGSEVKISVE